MSHHQQTQSMNNNNFHNDTFNIPKSLVNNGLEMESKNYNTHETIWMNERWRKKSNFHLILKYETIFSLFFIIFFLLAFLIKLPQFRDISCYPYTFCIWSYIHTHNMLLFCYSFHYNAVYIPHTIFNNISFLSPRTPTTSIVGVCRFF